MRLRFGRFAIGLGAAALAVGIGGQAHAAGFALKEQSGNALGSAFAGVTAGQGDASYSFFNPASLASLDGTHVSLTGSAIVPRSDPDGMQGTTAAGVPVRGGDGTSDAAVDAGVPAFYATTSISERVTAGLAINVPFGLETRYNDGWAGRYHALGSELITVNVNPMLAVQATDWLAVGAGAQAQYVDARLTNAVDFGSLGAAAGVPFARPTRQDGKAELEGDDWAYGVNLGLQVTPLEGTRVGIGYRSQIEHELDVEADFSGDRAGVARVLRARTGAFTDTSASAGLTTPDMISVGVSQRVTSKWTLLGEVQWTNWSTFHELRIDFDNPAQPDSVTEESWDDAWFASLGARYQPNETWSFRGGVAYDQSPIPDSTRTPRIPGGDRTWLAAGVQVKPVTGVVLDLSYAHIFVEDTRVSLDASDPGNAARGNLSGTYDNAIDLISVQATVQF